MASDLRLAARGLRKHPAFALTAIAALAIGIGANTAIFSTVRQVLLNPSGIDDPARVAAVRVSYDKLALRNIAISATDFAGVRDSPQIFEHAAIADRGSFNFTGAGAPQRIAGSEVSAEWFDVFGAKPILGRVFTAQEDQPNANQEAVLSYGTWQRLFGASPAAIGQIIELDQKPYRIVGVMPRDFRWPAASDLWTPLGLAPETFADANRFNESYLAAARLKPGVTIQRAAAFMNLLTNRVKSGSDQLAQYARDSAWSETVLPWTEFIAGDTKTPMLVLMGAVGFVLLIACANIAGLMLARGSGRTREIALRAALGAGRLDLIRHIAAESLAISISGAVAGIALGYLGLRSLAALAPADLPVSIEPRLDLALLLFTAAAAISSALICALAPAWQATRHGRFDALKDASRSSTAGVARQRLRAVLVAGEIALALLLLVGAGLLLRSLSALEGVDPGFDARGVTTGSVTLTPVPYPDEPRQALFYRNVLERLRAAPAVEFAGVAMPAPFSGESNSASFAIEGRTLPPGDPGPHGDLGFVSPGYFEALKIPLRAGRFFTSRDTASVEPVAIIDETLARQYWPNEDPLGKRIRGGSRQAWSTIVGVVGHVKSADLSGDTVKGKYYFDMDQRPVKMASIVVRSAGDTTGMAQAIRAAVAAVDPNEPVSQLLSMREMVDQSLASRRLIVTLLGIFAAIALLLAAVGLYGVISYSVAQRTQEFGIRMALGARREQILAAVIRDAAGLTAAGAFAGFLASAALSRVLQKQLFNVSPFDPLTFGAMAAVLLIAAMAASLIPAYRAANVDPMVALRYE